MTLTGRTALVAALGALVIFVAPSAGVALLVDGGLLVAVLADVVLAVPPGRLMLHAAGADHTRLGNPAEVALEVHNPTGRPARGTVRDAWPPSADARPSRQRLDVAAGGRRRLVTTLAPVRRGDRHRAFVAVRTIGPLGLAGRQGRRSAPWVVRVLPAFPSRRELPGKLSRLRELTGSARSLLRGHGTEFDSLREYVVGDDVRSVDVRASARRGGVVVRTWRPERDRRVVVVLDTGRTSAARVAGVPRLDAALDAVQLLTALATRAGDTVDVLAYDRRLRVAVSGVGRRDLLGAVVSATAPLEPALVETDMRAVVAEVLRRAPRRCLVVLLTTLDPAPMEEGLLPTLRALTTRHAVVVAAVADPAEGALATGRADAAAVYAAAAAERAAGERRRISTVLRRGGVEVVEAPPDALAAALADSYLRRKAAGGL